MKQWLLGLAMIGADQNQGNFDHVNHILTASALAAALLGAAPAFAADTAAMTSNALILKPLDADQAAAI